MFVMRLENIWVGNEVEATLLKRINMDSVERTKVRRTPLLDKSKIRIGDVIITIWETNFRAIVEDKSIENLVIVRSYPSREVNSEIGTAYSDSTPGQREIQKRVTGASIITKIKSAVAYYVIIKHIITAIKEMP